MCASKMIFKIFANKCNTYITAQIYRKYLIFINHNIFMVFLYSTANFTETLWP